MQTPRLTTLKVQPVANRDFNEKGSTSVGPLLYER